MRMLYVLLLCCLWVRVADATILGRMDGVVHDAQHRPVAGAGVRVQAAGSDVTVEVVTDAEGAFRVPGLPVGEYVVTVSAPGFTAARAAATVASGRAAVLHLQLQVVGIRETVTVEAGAGRQEAESVTPTTLVSREDVRQTPGADRSNSLQIITDFVPGAYMVHDQLHMRGGHQVSWLIDGVPIPNTNIGENVGAQIDPKDIDYLEVQRGSYAADVGDRTYGVFNVVPRTGFERDREGEAEVSFGSFRQTNDQVSLGSHTERFAWYGSLNGNRCDYGLEPPTAQVLHDAANGVGGFGSLVYNRDPRDQLRLVVQGRADYFQVPYDPDSSDVQSLRDGQHEHDLMAAFTWVHTLGTASVLEVSPFFHRNGVRYDPSATDTPVQTSSQRSSTYGGAQVSLGGEWKAGRWGTHRVSVGVFGFGQRDSDQFANVFSDGSAADFSIAGAAAGGVAEQFLSDQWKPADWLTLTAGLRTTEFRGGESESTVHPRLGIALRVPRLHWTLRGFYGRFYQPPPLLTAPGALRAYAGSAAQVFLPIHGERDEEHQFGVQIPWRGWLLDADTFQTRANNFLDHANLGESSLYFPLTIDGALISGWELTLQTPHLWRRGTGHLAYSNQVARQRGPITGGLGCASACDAIFAYTPLDHDQRNTLSAGYRMDLGWGMNAAAEYSYGSGFHNGMPDDVYPGAYLPSHSSVDLSLGRDFERASVSVQSVNLFNQRRLLDNSLTFGGLHFSDPRQVFGEVRWRFKY